MYTHLLWSQLMTSWKKCWHWTFPFSFWCLKHLFHFKGVGKRLIAIAWASLFDLFMCLCLLFVELREAVNLYIGFNSIPKDARQLHMQTLLPTLFKNVIVWLITFLVAVKCISLYAQGKKEVINSAHLEVTAFFLLLAASSGVVYRFYKLHTWAVYYLYCAFWETYSTDSRKM